MRERTGELTRLNAELERAKGEADDANASKTRFIADASHDISQPLNAARLYVTSLIERQRAGEDGDLVQNIDASLEAVEEIFVALLDISRLDTGAMKPEFSDFRIDELLQRLEVEFTPMAQEKGLELKFMPCALAVRSDRRLLRRLVQNLVSNAIKYTPAGTVLVGCRRRGPRLRVDVYDTGIGIPHAKRRAVFKEFHRLDQGARVARGVGLGLSIVERVARVLDCEVALTSNVGRGSRFSVEVPRAAAGAVEPLQRAMPKSPPGGSPERWSSASTTKRPFSTACRRCSAAGAAKCSRRPTSPRRWRRSNAAAASRTGSWSTTTSTAATAWPRSPSCAGAPAATCRRSWSPPTVPCASARKPAPPASTCSTSRSSRLRYGHSSAVAGAARRGGMTGVTLPAPAAAAIGRLRSCRRR